MSDRCCMTCKWYDAPRTGAWAGWCNEPSRTRLAPDHSVVECQVIPSHVCEKWEENHEQPNMQDV